MKYEDWKVALAYFTKGSYVFSFDLKKAYSGTLSRRNLKRLWAI